MSIVRTDTCSCWGFVHTVGFRSVEQRCEIGSAPGYILADSTRLNRARCLPRIFVKHWVH